MTAAGQSAATDEALPRIESTTDEEARCGGFATRRGAQAAQGCAPSQRWRRYSEGLVPTIRRNTVAKCCWVSNPTESATSRTETRGSPSGIFSRSILSRNMYWCGLACVDRRNWCAKCDTLRSAAAARFSRLTGLSMFDSINSSTRRKRNGASRLLETNLFVLRPSRRKQRGLLRGHSRRRQEKAVPPGSRALVRLRPREANSRA